MQKLQLLFFLFTVTIVLGQEEKDTTEILLSQFKTKMEKDSISDLIRYPLLKRLELNLGRLKI